MAYATVSWSPEYEEPKTGCKPVVIVPQNTLKDHEVIRKIAKKENDLHNNNRDIDNQFDSPTFSSATTKASLRGSPMSSFDDDHMSNHSGNNSPKSVRSGKSTKSTMTNGGSGGGNSNLNLRNSTNTNCNSNSNFLNLKTNYTRRIERHNASFMELKLEEAIVNNPYTNQAYMKFKPAPFNFQPDSTVEYVRNRFVVKNLDLLPGGTNYCNCSNTNNLLKTALDWEIMEKSSCYDKFASETYSINNLSYLAFPKYSKQYSDISDLEMISYLLNKETSYSCAIVAHLTDKVEHVTLCGPICNNFQQGCDVVVTTTCYGRYRGVSSPEVVFKCVHDSDTQNFTNNLCDLNNMGRSLKDSASVVSISAKLSSFTSCGGVTNNNNTVNGAEIAQGFMETETDKISIFCSPTIVSLETKNRRFCPALSSEDCPFGVWVSDKFLEKYQCKYGDFVAVFDQKGTYHWDFLRKSPFQEVDGYVTGYAVDENVELQLTSCRSVRLPPQLTLSSYWKLITPALWDLKALAQNIGDMILQQLPESNLFINDPNDNSITRKKHKSEIRILHASCGAGHLCYELMNLGFTNVEMSDASPEMIQLANRVGSTTEEFQEVYNNMGRKPMLCRWGELPEKVLENEKYDVVLIRGNSTPYVNGVWDRQHTHSQQDTIEEMINSLRGVKSVLNRGGFLYLDKCHEETSMTKVIHYDKIEEFPCAKPEILQSVKNKIESLHWEFITDVEKYSRTWKMKSKLVGSENGCDSGSANKNQDNADATNRSPMFEREVTGFFLTERVLKGLSRHLGFESCERHQLEYEKIYKGYILRTKSGLKDEEYYDEHLARYLRVWIGDSARNSAINWGLWEEATSWSQSQEERYQSLLKSIKPIIERSKKNNLKFRVLDVGCGTGYSLDRLFRDFEGMMDGVGIDPSGAEIDFANRIFGRTCEKTGCKLEFLKKTSTELIEEDMNNEYIGQFDVVIAESAIAHAPPEFRKKFPEECYRFLRNKNPVQSDSDDDPYRNLCGILAFNDPILGEKAAINSNNSSYEVDTDTAVFTLLRLGFEKLWTLGEWKNRLLNNLFSQVDAICHGWSQSRSYRYLATQAEANGYSELAEDYRISAENIRKGFFSWGHFVALKMENESEETM